MRHARSLEKKQDGLSKQNKLFINTTVSDFIHWLKRHIKLSFEETLSISNVEL